MVPPVITESVPVPEVSTTIIVPPVSSYYAPPPPPVITESVPIPEASTSVVVPGPSSSYKATPPASSSTGHVSSATTPGYPEYTGAASSTKPLAAFMAGAAALAYFV